MTPDDRATIRRTARLAGGLYLALVPLGIFSFVYVPSRVWVPGDAPATAGNIVASESLFRLGTASHLLSQVIVVFLMLQLCRVFRPVNANRATVMVALALVCVPISFAAETNSLGAVQILASSRDAAGGGCCDPRAAGVLGVRRPGPHERGRDQGCRPSRRRRLGPSRADVRGGGHRRARRSGLPARRASKDRPQPVERILGDARSSGVSGRSAGWRNDS